MHSLLRRVLFEKEMLKTVMLSANDADNIINSTYAHACPYFVQQNTIRKEYDLMIIVPVYNVENYLRECLDSILSQKTRYSFCVVAVEDGSTDGSAAILKEYESYGNVRVIYQENKGHSGSRNTALKEICARYVMFVDSDDVLPENAIERMMATATEKNADIVQGAYVKFNGEREFGQFDVVEKVTRLPFYQVSGYTCMKAFRSDLLEHFCFPEGFLYEDTVLGKLLFPQCEICYAIPDVVYLYRIHSEAVSNASQTERNLDTYWITKYCLEEAVRRGYTLDSCMYEQYLRQCRVNFLRTQYLSEEIQESVFVATAGLYEQHFGGVKLHTKENKLKLLHRALKKRSFAAYVYLMKRWEIM